MVKHVHSDHVVAGSNPGPLALYSMFFPRYFRHIRDSNPGPASTIGFSPAAYATEPRLLWVCVFRFFRTFLLRGVQNGTHIAVLRTLVPLISGHPYTAFCSLTSGHSNRASGESLRGDEPQRKNIAKKLLQNI